MKKVIYILSVGHSGSTLLDIVLGQFNNTFSTGELKELTWQYYRQIKNNPSSQLCTCGKSFDKCNIWYPVIKDLSKYGRIRKELVPKKIKIKHLDSLSFQKDIQIDKLLRSFYKWNLSKRLIPLIIFNKYFQRINNNNVQLYNSLFRNIVEIKYIIDSSKDIIRYNELKNKISAFPIILIRNINDWTKSRYVEGSKKSIQAWQKYYNKNCLPIIKNLNEKDFHIINYEMFISDPKTEIASLSEKLDLNMKEFNTTINMQDSHLVAGNPMRYEKKINIKQKDYLKEQVLANLEKVGLDNFFLERI